MSTFKIMSDRIMAELRRTNLEVEVRQAINDAITEAAKERFYFNEMVVSFPTVALTRDYTDRGIVEIDAAWYWRNDIVNGTRENIYIENALDADDMRIGNAFNGQIQSLSRYGGMLRIEPIPAGVTTIYLEGYGKLTPNPLVLDADTNAWMTEGELYVRALAKRNILRDVARDYGEARILDVIAEDYKNILIVDSAMRNNTNTIKATQW